MADKTGEKEIPKEVQQRYNQRLVYLKNGREFFKMEDFVNATKSYTAYLQIISEYKGVNERKLRPEHFDKVNDLTELLLISHVYWDLAKIYDRTPSLASEFDRALKQFVNFTLNFKYQVPNSGMIRRFIKKKKLVHKKEFEEAWKQLDLNSGKCYVATYCYHATHPNVVKLRSLRDDLSHYFLCRLIIKFYYKISPGFTHYMVKHPLIGRPLKTIFFKPIIYTIIKILNLGYKRP